MKTLTLLMLSSLICLSAQATTGRLISLTLENERKISVSSDIKELVLGPQNKIELIELNNGEIFYDTEIKEATLIFMKSKEISIPLDKIRMLNRSILSRRVGGDGSGGG